MTTATEKLLSENRDELDNYILNQRMEHFIKKYAPKDAYDASQFHVALHELMRATFAEASKPYERTMSAMMKNMAPLTMMPFTPKTKKTARQSAF